MKDRVQVRRVIDGDTIAIITDEGIERIRLAHIDAPENGQPGCREAREYLSNMIGDGEIEIEWKERDKYGRKICEVVNDLGMNINEDMIMTGMAWHKEYRGKREDLEIVGRKEMIEKKGLFRERNTERPWEWRKRKTKR